MLGLPAQNWNTSYLIPRRLHPAVPLAEVENLLQCLWLMVCYAPSLSMALGNLFLEALYLLFQRRGGIRSVRKEYIDAVGSSQALQTLFHRLLDGRTAEVAAAITHLGIHLGVEDEGIAQPLIGFAEKLL